MKRILLLSSVILLTVSLIAQNVPRDKVVVEIGTGTWCPYCPGAAMGADELIENGHDVAVIEYHNGDSYANVFSNYRNSYYNVSGYPTAHFDGQNPYVGGSSTQSMYPQYLSRVNQRLSVTSSYTLDVTGTHEGLKEFNIEVTIDKVGTHNGQNTVLHAVVTESHIEEYWQGMDDLNFVCRLMAPNQYGTPLDFSGGDTQVVNLSFTMDDEWVVENCELVVFVQSTTNKEILQGTNIGLLEFPSEFNDDANLKAVANLPQTTCSGSMQPVITLRNLGNDDLTSLDISYYVNSGEPQIYNWTGTLAYLEEAEVELDEVFFEVLEENEIEIITENPNGNPDEYPVNNDASQNVSQGETTPSVVNLIMRTDNNPEETTWEMVNSSGDVLYSGGPYSSSGQMIMEAFELSELDCYAFIIYDSGNDGLNQPGFYMLYHGDNNVIAEGTGFGAKDHTEFTPENTVGLNDEPPLYDPIQIYPNPFSRETTVQLSLVEDLPVRMEVFSVTGEKVFESDEGILNSGLHLINLNLKGKSAGLYIVKLMAGKEVITKKITLR